MARLKGWIGQGHNLYGVRDAGPVDGGWLWLQTCILEQNAACVSAALGSPQMLAMALAQAMTRGIRDIATPQRRGGPGVSRGRNQGLVRAALERSCCRGARGGTSGLRPQQ
eukprot:11377311-Alexandrium_andersonii.AAC.1